MIASLTPKPREVWDVIPDRRTPAQRMYDGPPVGEYEFDEQYRDAFLMLDSLFERHRMSGNQTPLDCPCEAVRRLHRADQAREEAV